MQKVIIGTTEKQPLRLEDIFDSLEGFTQDTHRAYQTKQTPVNNAVYLVKLSGVDNGRVLQFYKTPKVDEKVVNLPYPLLELKYVAHNTNKQATIFPVISSGIFNSKEGPKPSFELLDHVNAKIPAGNKIIFMSSSDKTFKTLNDHAFLY